MTDEITKTDNTGTAAPAKASRKTQPHHTEGWNGYTLEQIRYQRAYTLARMEINRERVKQGSSRLASGSPATSSRNLILKAIGAFSYIDLAIIAWRFGSKILRARKLIRK